MILGLFGKWDYLENAEGVVRASSAFFLWMTLGTGMSGSKPSGFSISRVRTVHVHLSALVGLTILGFAC